MISASPIAGCPSFKFLTMQMQPSASCARMWTVLSATIMFADKPHRLNERTSAQRFCVLTILPPVTALAVGLPAQRAIAQRFRALALFGLADRARECRLLGVERTSGWRQPMSRIGGFRTCRPRRQMSVPGGRPEVAQTGCDFAFGPRLCKNSPKQAADRINVLPRRILVLWLSQARLISVNLRRLF